MARGGISFDGIGAHQTTFKAGTALKAVVVANDRDFVVNMAVAISGAATADFGTNSDALLGFVDVFENDGFVGVQDRGYRVGVPAVSASVGQIAVVDGTGNVKGAANTNKLRSPIFVEVDAEAETATVFLG